MPHQVFLSHASEDAAKAEKLCGALESAGMACWIAPRDIPGGASYSGEIVRAINSARMLVLLYSRHSAQSRHVRSELEIAFNDGDAILAIRLEDYEMPTELQYFLSTGQWIDAFERDFDLDLDKVVESIKGVIAGSPVPGPDHVPHYRRLLPYVASFGIILVAAVWLVYGTLTKEAAIASAVESRSADRPTPEKPLPEASAQSINSKDGLTYVRIPSGRYLMGCSAADSECDEDEKPAHWVDIPKAFWMGQSEVTVSAFRKYAETIGRNLRVADDQLPITEVDRAEAVAYCRWAGGRLPSEAEWEYAARGGQSEPRYGPLRDIAWIDSNSNEAAHPVGQKQANAYGLHDMLGNVAEWVLDRYYNRYDTDDANPVPEEPLAGNATAVVRGGSWAYGPQSARASNRTEMEKDAAEPFVGFRCIRDAR